MSITDGSLGVWAQIDNFSAQEAVGFAAAIEELGYSALWIPEAVGRDPFAIIAFMAASTERLVFATGIANIYARDPMAMKALHKTMEELAPGRFVLGLGVSHEHFVSGVRGHDFGKPVTTMRNYLEAMEEALYMGPEPAQDAPIVIAALRHNMLKLAADKTHGAHPYLVTPAHTRMAREVLGPKPWLCTEQMILQQQDPDRAREIARKHLSIYLGLPNYQNSLLEQGFSNEDFADDGSDRLVDEIVAWGDEARIRARIQEHFDAGANHVCVQAFRADGETGPDIGLLRRLGPAGCG
jgi:probable F420-dependent oxidoreductase